MGLVATLVTFTANTVIHAADVNSNFTNLNAVNQILNGTDVTQIVGHNLTGSSDSGVYQAVNAVTITSAVSTLMKFNVKFDGSNDRFITTQSFPAYELVVNGSGVAARKSNSNATAGNVITWLSYTFLFT